MLTFISLPEAQLRFEVTLRKVPDRETLVSGEVFPTFLTIGTIPSQSYCRIWQIV